uniref:Uncharacterized protein n=1 Tax=Setaria viridis TaxID=4556 RepID=A0A4U6WC95_SETVI|nr:hypothetical protein SEVIR_1G171301v2 [Setaria viridis]
MPARRRSLVPPCPAAPPPLLFPRPLVQALPFLFFSLFPICSSLPAALSSLPCQGWARSPPFHGGIPYLVAESSPFHGGARVKFGRRLGRAQASAGTGGGRAKDGRRSSGGGGDLGGRGWVGGWWPASGQWTERRRWGAARRTEKSLERRLASPASETQYSNPGFGLVY